MQGSKSITTPEVRTAVHGEFPLGAADYAREKVAKLLTLAHGPVLTARVRLTRHGDPAVPQPVVAQANLDVNGQLLRAQAQGPGTWEAVDRLEAKLRSQLERWVRRHEPRGAYARHHHQNHRQLPIYLPRLAEAREIVRHKSVAPARTTVVEAAADLDLLDHEFHLFTEAGSEQDSVVYRAGPTGYRLAQVTPPAAPAPHPADLPVTISAQPAPLLTTAEAVERLSLTGLPFLFFLDAESGRGAVLYLRYDGHFALIMPAV